MGRMNLYKIANKGEEFMIFETHAHYDDAAFDEDRDLLLGQMAGGGIGTIINVGASLATTAKSLALAEKYPFVYAAVGVHPDETKELNEENFQWLKEQCAHPRTVAVGEIGLDYYWDETPRDVQKKWFIRQMELSVETDLPMIVHSREAAADTFELVKEHHAGTTGGVIHCYSYSREMALEYIRLGYHIGVGGVVTFKNGRRLKETVEAIPLERILLETDCPYMAPVPYRGKRNSSLYIPYIVEEIAALKGVSAETVIEVTRHSAEQLFKRAR